MYIFLLKDKRYIFREKDVWWSDQNGLCAESLQYNFGVIEKRKGVEVYQSSMIKDGWNCKYC